MNIRRKARETALQVLYRVDIADISLGEGFEAEMEELAPGTEARRYCEVLVHGVLDNRRKLDSTIERYSENWTIERMAVVDRNVLRVAVYELQYCKDIPYKVIIDEAVELAKRFGSDESGAFINGILDKIRKDIDEKPRSAAKF
ncbi:MAG: transcription antitermination factor NusB [Deltaproteobacteria bacterium]|nr:transcription antitermination factor NusB [Deltaproteobacteria bacterium]